MALRSAMREDPDVILVGELMLVSVYKHIQLDLQLLKYDNFSVYSLNQSLLLE